ATNTVDDLETARVLNDLGRGLPKQVVLQPAILFEFFLCERTEEVNEDVLSFPAVHHKVQFGVIDLSSKSTQKCLPSNAVGRMAVDNNPIHVEYDCLQHRFRSGCKNRGRFAHAVNPGQVSCAS